MNTFIELKANNKSIAKRKIVHGVGINDASYITQPTINGKRSTCPFYKSWESMLSRCYSSSLHKRQPTYIECTVCDEWLTFSNFKSWMVKQCWTNKCLDKDLLSQGNKVYSPDMCLFVSNDINVLLTDRLAKRGMYPQGVSYHKISKKFRARVSVNGKSKHLGLFPTEYQAYQAYKKSKYDNIADIAINQEEPLRSALLAYRLP